ncbi:MAG: hypothetical protein M3Y07_06305 [Acidobacteriota bacterium]|nr:hypothetical protein [Acidobacteriota bacterium]
MKLEIEVENEVEEPDQCRSCMGDHDEHIHAATLRVRGWLRSEINRKLAPILAEAA